MNPLTVSDSNASPSDPVETPFYYPKNYLTGLSVVLCRNLPSLSGPGLSSWTTCGPRDRWRGVWDVSWVVGRRRLGTTRDESSVRGFLFPLGLSNFSGHTIGPLSSSLRSLVKGQTCIH